MSRFAIFVDAGYLFAQGSVLVSGTMQPRWQLSLDRAAIFAELHALGEELCPGSQLLRVYWYDGARPSATMNEQHAAIALADNVKLRLAMMTREGRQKGVDPLITLDLTELARNHAIKDAILVSGDDNMRIGVQSAQAFGVRVHLLGVAPSRMTQSLSLLHEADTTREWGAEKIRTFLSVIDIPENQGEGGNNNQQMTGAGPISAEMSENDAIFESVAQELADSLSDEEIANLQTYWNRQTGIPPEFDRELLVSSRAAFGRDLTIDEKRHLRNIFSITVKKILDEAAEDGEE